MSIDDITERRFEEDIEAVFLSPAGSYVKGTDTYDAKSGLYVNTLIDFIRKTQPREWARFENVNKVDCLGVAARFQTSRHHFSRLLLQACLSAQQRRQHYFFKRYRRN